VKQMAKRMLFLAFPIFILLIGCSKKEENPYTSFAGYVENTQVNVTTRMPGLIKKIFCDEGDYVEKGDTVAVLDKKELLANRKALVARLSNIKVNKKRVQNLFDAGAVPQQKLDEIETNYQIVYDKLLALDTKLEDMTVISPLSGVVVTKVLEEGQMMPPGMPVVIVSDTSITYARFSIPESYFDQISLGGKFTLSTAVKDAKVQATVFQIVPMADFATHTPTDLRGQSDVRSFSVKMKFDHYYKLLKPGMSVYLQLKNPAKEGA